MFVRITELLDDIQDQRSSTPAAHHFELLPSRAGGMFIDTSVAGSLAQYAWRGWGCATFFTHHYFGYGRRAKSPNSQQAAVHYNNSSVHLICQQRQGSFVRLTLKAGQSYKMGDIVFLKWLLATSSGRLGHVDTKAANDAHSAISSDGCRVFLRQQVLEPVGIGIVAQPSFLSAAIDECFDMQPLG